MNRIKAGEGLPLAPSICFICEESPQVDVVDTARNNETPLPTKLRGRKYVCVSCITELAKFIGMVEQAVYDVVETEVDARDRELAEARLRIEQLEAVHVEMLKDLLDKAVRPHPTKAEEAEARAAETAYTEEISAQGEDPEQLAEKKAERKSAGA